MHEGRLPNTFQHFLQNSVSAEELDIMRTIVRATVSLGNAHYFKTVVPKDALARALNIFRHIRYLYPDGKATIFEIGSGSGYLGALLLLGGYSYVSTDISQAFYLFQNHLMNVIAPGRVIELADDPRSTADFDRIQPGYALHIPWWKWFLPSPSFPLKADVVTANHCLCEMDPHSLLYNVKTAATLLANQGDRGCFLYEGWGSNVLHPDWTVSKAFMDNGYTLARHCLTASVWTRADGPFPGIAFPLPQRKKGLFSRLGKDQLTDSVRIAELYDPPQYTDQEHPISAQIAEGQGRFAKDRHFTINDFETMLLEEAKGASINSDDDVFNNYIGVSF